MTITWHTVRDASQWRVDHAFGTSSVRYKGHLITHVPMQSLTPERAEEFISKMTAKLEASPILVVLMCVNKKRLGSFAWGGWDVPAVLELVHAAATLEQHFPSEVAVAVDMFSRFIDAGTQFNGALTQPHLAALIIPPLRESRRNDGRRLRVHGKYDPSKFNGALQFKMSLHNSHNHGRSVWAFKTTHSLLFTLESMMQMEDLNEINEIDLRAMMALRAIFLTHEQVKSVHDDLKLLQI